MNEETEEHDLGSRHLPAEVRKGLITVQGNTLYLKAQYRILWMRSEHADWEIRTEIVEGGYQAGFVVVKATICNENGRVLATAHKEEKSGKFPFLSKAETGAIARALAIVGYGTQFGEIDDDGPDSVADSPIPYGARNAPPQRNEWTKQPQQRHNEQVYGQRPPNVDANGEIHDGIPSRPPLSKQQQATINKAEASTNLKAILDEGGWCPRDAQHYKEMLFVIRPDIRPDDWKTQDYIDAANLPLDRIATHIKQMNISPAQQIKESLPHVA